MQILNKDEFKLKKRAYLKKLRSSIFIYPTDTIYGLGCDAKDEQLVKKLRNIKKNFAHPFSIIVPSRKWIEDNCEINTNVKKWLKELPGPYTLILNLNNEKAVAPSVYLDENTIGIRIPANWFTNIVQELETPIVTTSANITGEDFMTSLDNLNPEIKKKIDLIIYDGEIKGRPSTLIHLEKKKVLIRKR